MATRRRRANCRPGPSPNVGRPVGDAVRLEQFAQPHEQQGDCGPVARRAPLAPALPPGPARQHQPGRAGRALGHQPHLRNVHRQQGGHRMPLGQHGCHDRPGGEQDHDDGQRPDRVAQRIASRRATSASTGKQEQQATGRHPLGKLGGLCISGPTSATTGRASAEQDERGTGAGGLLIVGEPPADQPQARPRSGTGRRKASARPAGPAGRSTRATTGSPQTRAHHAASADDQQSPRRARCFDRRLTSASRRARNSASPKPCCALPISHGLRQ